MLFVAKVVFRASSLNTVRGLASYSSQPLAIVTGGVQGIGYTVSERLLREGYRVCLADIDEDKGNESLAKLQKQYGAEKALFKKCDVTSEDSFRETFSKVQEVGRIGLLVNNAGIVDEYDAKRTVAVNLMGTITGCQLALEFMSTKAGGKGGIVINMGSLNSIIPYANAPVYVATKHGIIGLTRSYGDESHFKENKVTFMVICPGYVKTPILQSAKPLTVWKHLPLEHLRPEMVGDGVSKLLKDRINGSVLIVVRQEMKYTELPKEAKNIPVYP